MDGCATFWDITWPKNGIVRDLAYQMYQYVKENVEVFLVFDRYFKYSIKGATREQRTGNITNNHILTLDSPLQAREIMMKSSKNKTQVIDIVSKFIIHLLSINRFTKRFVVTFPEPTPIQVEDGVTISRDDLKTFHEEADVNIIRQCLKCAEEGMSPIKIISDDTDVFVLLTSYVQCRSLKASVVNGIIFKCLHIDKYQRNYKETFRYYSINHPCAYCFRMRQCPKNVWDRKKKGCQGVAGW